MYRYGKYFRGNVLWLDNGFCQYYVQDILNGPLDILDAESIIFDWPEEAEQLLLECAHYNDFLTYSRMRSFLANHSLDFFALHRMDNYAVLKAEQPVSYAATGTGL